MSKKDKTSEEIPEGQKKTAISDKEKERILKEHGTRKFTLEEWFKALNKASNF